MYAGNSRMNRWDLFTFEKSISEPIRFELSMMLPVLDIRKREFATFTPRRLFLLCRLKFDFDLHLCLSNRRLLLRSNSTLKYSVDMCESRINDVNLPALTSPPSHGRAIVGSRENVQVTNRVTKIFSLPSRTRYSRIKPFEQLKFSTVHLTSLKHRPDVEKIWIWKIVFHFFFQVINRNQWKLPLSTRRSSFACKLRREGNESLLNRILDNTITSLSTRFYRRHRAELGICF